MNYFNRNDSAVPSQEVPRRSVTPRYEVKETAEAFVITAYMPGIDRKSIETHVDGDNLTVVARNAWTPPEHWTAVYRETPVVDYRLVLELDHRINREAVGAELTQGVLKLTLPKAEAVKLRRIEIKD